MPNYASNSRYLNKSHFFDRFKSGTLINEACIMLSRSFTNFLSSSFLAVFNGSHVCLSLQLSAIFLLERTDFLPETVRQFD